MSTKYELKNLATGKTTLLNAVSGTIGPEALEQFRTLDQGTRGCLLFEPGFMATASTESKITYIEARRDAAVIRLPGGAARGEVELSRGGQSTDSTGSLPTKTHAVRVPKFESAAHHGQRTAAAFFPKASITMRTPWPWCPRGCFDGRVLS